MFKKNGNKQKIPLSENEQIGFQCFSLQEKKNKEIKFLVLTRHFGNLLTLQIQLENENFYMKLKFQKRMKKAV